MSSQIISKQLWTPSDLDSEGLLTASVPPSSFKRLLETSAFFTFFASGTTPRPVRFGGMGRPATRGRVASVWQKLASVIATLAVTMFVAHGAVAKGAVPYPYGHDHPVAHAGTSLIADHVPAEQDGHKHSSSVSHKHRTAKDGAAPCCGEACLLALMPDIDTHLSNPWGVRSSSLLRVSSLSGHDPDGLRRPPRLLHRI